MTLKVGDKISVIETYQESWVTIAKKNTIGFVKEIKMGNRYVKNVLTPTLLVTFEKLNGEEITVPDFVVAPYKKREVKTIKSMTNEELLEKYTELILAEAHARSVKTKAYNKTLEDIQRHEVELLNRLNNK